MRLPGSSTRVGRPVSLPRALATALLPVPGGRVEKPNHLVPWGKLVRLRGHAAGDLLQLRTVGQLMRDQREELLQFDRNLNHGRQDDHECPRLFAADHLPGQRLDDLSRLEESVEILENQNCRAVRSGQRVDRPNGGQRIVGPGIGRLAASGDLQPLVDVPRRKPPPMLAADLRDFRKRVLVFVRLNPQARRAGVDMFDQPL